MTTLYQLVVFACLLHASLPLGKGWSEGQNPDFNDDFYERDRRREKRQKLIVTTILQPPFMMLKQDGAFLTGNERFEGFLADLLSRLTYGIGVDYEIRLVRDGKYGSPGDSPGENGTWTGMIGELIRAEADIAAGPISVMAPYTKVVDFTEPFMVLRSSALIRKTKKRISQLKTVEDLQKSKLKYGVMTDSVTSKLFSKSDTVLYSRMYSKMAQTWPSVFVHSLNEGVQRARSRRERYAFILDAPFAEYVARRQPCDLFTIEPFLRQQRYAFALPKDSSFKTAMDLELAKMKKNEDIHFTYLKWWHDECQEVSVTTKANSRRNLTPTYPSPWRSATAAGWSSTAQCLRPQLLLVFIWLLVNYLY